MTFVLPQTQSRLRTSRCRALPPAPSLRRVYIPSSSQRDESLWPLPSLFLFLIAAATTGTGSPIFAYGFVHTANFVLQYSPAPNVRICRFTISISSHTRVQRVLQLISRFRSPQASLNTSWSGAWARTLIDELTLACAALRWKSSTPIAALTSLAPSTLFCTTYPTALPYPLCIAN